LPDQFEDVAYSPVLLPNHGAGVGRGACLQLLDITDSPPASDVDHGCMPHAHGPVAVDLDQQQVVPACPSSAPDGPPHGLTPPASPASAPDGLPHGPTPLVPPAREAPASPEPASPGPRSPLPVRACDASFYASVCHAFVCDGC